MEETREEEQHPAATTRTPAADRPFARSKTELGDVGAEEASSSRVPNKGAKAALALFELHSLQMEQLIRQEEAPAQTRPRRASSMRVRSEVTPVHEGANTVQPSLSNSPKLSPNQTPRARSRHGSLSVTQLTNPGTSMGLSSAFSASLHHVSSNSSQSSTLRQARLSVVELDALRRLSSTRGSLTYVPETTEVPDSIEVTEVSNVTPPTLERGVPVQPARHESEI
jgi:hypothetical protein